MGLNIRNISYGNNSNVNYQSNKDDRTSFCASKKDSYTPTINKSNDGKFSFSQAMKNFAHGLVSPITNMFSSPTNFLIGAGVMAGSVLLVGATGGAAAPFLVAAGVTMGAIQAGEGISKIVKAKNGDDVEKAFYDLGGATSTIGLSVTGAKNSLKQANIDSKELGIFGATKKCFTSLTGLAKESFDVVKFGHYKTNWSNSYRNTLQPRVLKRYANELYEDGKQNFHESFNAIKNILPDEFKSRLEGRNKCEVSIYDRMVRERTMTIDDKIKTVQNNTNYAEEIKQQKIAELLEQRNKIKSDANFAKEKVGDLYGARLTLDDVSHNGIDKLVSALTKAIEKGDIELIEIENYRGINKKYTGKNKFYFSEDQIKCLSEASGMAEVRNAPKSSGYTAVQMKIKPKSGKVVELQIRGKYVDEVANWEHIPYDLRQGKDISKGNNQTGILLSKVQKAIKGLSDEQYKKYQEYIYKNYAYAQSRELGQVAVKPVLPDGIDSILSADSLQLLYNQTKNLASGSINDPFDFPSQFSVLAGSENLSDKG